MKSLSEVLDELNENIDKANAAIDIIEYAAANHQPIPDVSKATLKKSLEDITDICQTYFEVDSERDS